MTAPNDDCTSLDHGDIRFYDNVVPTLEVGDYLINVTQQINPKNSAIDECFAASQVFSVRGPRYALPSGDIFSIFPPNNSRGVFDQFLPHVVMSKRDLPWERNVFREEDRARQTPWMALLLFVEGEQMDGQSPLLPPPVADRLETISVPAYDFYHHATGDGTLWPTLEAGWYESEDFLRSTICSVIDLSPQAFATLIPGKADLRYLAHARQVDPTAKESAVLKVSGDGWYSVVVGNRLPDAPAAGSQLPGQRNIVHLVSLEGFEDYLDGTPLPAGTTRVRMISLKGWTFTCLPEQGESFSEIMSGLLKDQVGTEKPTRFALAVDQPIDTAPEYQYAYQSLQNGYVPLHYQPRSGEQTFAWYRGPFSPVPVKNFISATQQTASDPAGWQPFATASSALGYDKDYGVFDVSYAVAWESGRLLALSDQSFGQALLNWQRQGHNLIDLILERKSQVAALNNLDPDSPDPQTEASLLDQIRAYAVTDDFMTYLVTQFAGQLAPGTAGPPPDSPPPPFPAYPDLPTPPTNPQTIAALLQEADVAQAVREVGGQQLDQIADWLARRYLLIGVPFENLVANSALLPPESVRFFYIDSNWLDALAEGALSIGIESSRDRLYQDLMKDLIWNTAFAALQQVRNNLLGTSQPVAGAPAFDQQAMAGMLLRSAAVSGWPGLEVNAYAETQGGSARPDISSHINLIRMERLSSDVLLCMWPAVPAVVTIDEPHEGVAFGFEDPPPGKGEGYYLYLRSLASAQYGTPLCSDQADENDTCQCMIDAVASRIIDPVTRIIRINGAGGLLASIQNLLPGNPTVNVRDFALQMIKVPEQAVFASPPTAE